VSIAGGVSETVDPKVLHGPDFMDAAEKFPDATKALALGWVPSRTIEMIVRDVVG
jgi:hypothetical protein